RTREGRVEGQGVPPNRCAQRAEPRLGLMPPAGCSGLSGASRRGWFRRPKAGFPEECAQVPSAIMLSFGAIGAALRRPSALAGPARNPPFVVVRHLASKRGALRLGVVRLMRAGADPTVLCVWRTT